MEKVYEKRNNFFLPIFRKIYAVLLQFIYFYALCLWLCRIFASCIFLVHFILKFYVYNEIWLYAALTLHIKIQKFHTCT